ncbi:MAG: phytoene desaturase family protein, partial [Chloroflexota bacterium]
AAAIVGAIDPKQLLASLVDPVAIGPTMRWRASNLRTPGVSTKVNLVLDALPAFTARGDDERLLRGRILIGATSIDDMERAFDATKYGRLPERPVLEVTIPSLADPALVDGAPTGTHVASAIVQWTVSTLRDADWEACRETIGDLALAMLDEVAPGTSARVRARQVLTPADLEREYGLTGGHPMHVEPALDSFFLWRPLLGWSRYRMPVEGLYLAGSGAHPGGGVTGLPGRNAAREVVADAKRRR